MPLIWMAFAAIAFFMFVFTATNLSGNTTVFLAIGWFVVFVVTIFEAGNLYLVSRRKPTKEEQDEEYWEDFHRRHRRR